MRTAGHHNQTSPYYAPWFGTFSQLPAPGVAPFHDSRSLDDVKQPFGLTSYSIPVGASGYFSTPWVVHKGFEEYSEWAKGEAIPEAMVSNALSLFFLVKARRSVDDWIIHKVQELTKWTGLIQSKLVTGPLTEGQRHLLTGKLTVAENWRFERDMREVMGGAARGGPDRALQAGIDVMWFLSDVVACHMSSEQMKERAKQLVSQYSDG